MARKSSCFCVLFQSAQGKGQLVSLLVQPSVSNEQTVLLALCSPPHSKSFLNSGRLLGLHLMVSLHMFPVCLMKFFPFPQMLLGLITLHLPLNYAI